MKEKPHVYLANTNLSFQVIFVFKTINENPTKD